MIGLRRRASRHARAATLAGTGKRGLSGDGGPAKNVPYLDPQALAVDGKGNPPTADTRENRVRIAYRIATP
jgi:hypothetical protein